MTAVEVAAENFKQKVACYTVQCIQYDQCYSNIVFIFFHQINTNVISLIPCSLEVEIATTKSTKSFTDSKVRV